MRTEKKKKAKYRRLKVNFSQSCSVKSIGSSWENLTIQQGLKGLATLQLSFFLKLWFYSVPSCNFNIFLLAHNVDPCFPASPLVHL